MWDVSEFICIVTVTRGHRDQPYFTDGEAEAQPSQILVPEKPPPKLDGPGLNPASAPTGQVT